MNMQANDFSGNNDNVTITPEGARVKPLSPERIAARLATKLSQSEVLMKGYVQRFWTSNGRAPFNVLEMMEYLKKVAPSVLPASEESNEEIVSEEKSLVRNTHTNDVFVRTGNPKGAQALYFAKYGRAFIDLERHAKIMKSSQSYWLTDADAKLYRTLVRSGKARDVATFVAMAREVHEGVFFVRVTQEMISGDGWHTFVQAVEAEGIAIGVPGVGVPHKVGQQAKVPAVNQQPKGTKSEGSYLNTPRPTVAGGMTIGGGVCVVPFNGSVDLPLVNGWVGEVDGQEVVNDFEPFTKRLVDAVKAKADAKTFIVIARELTELAYLHGVTSVTLDFYKGKIADAIKSNLKGKLPKWLVVQANWREQKGINLTPKGEAGKTAGGAEKRLKAAAKRQEQQEADRARTAATKGKTGQKPPKGRRS